MENPHPPIPNPFLSASSPSPKPFEAGDILSDSFSPSQSHMGDDHLKRAQDRFDGLLNDVMCTNDDITEVFFLNFCLE